MEDVNKQLMDLWEKTSKEHLNGLMPFFLDEFKRDAVVFIGINPSFSVRGFEKGLRSSKKYSGLDIAKFYSYPESEIFSVKDALEIENIMRTEYRYFDSFDDLLENSGVPWNHMDLFYVRKTSQDELGTLIFERGEELNGFGQEQLKITKEVLEGISPRAIVVVNALASRIYKNEFGLDPFDENYGCYFSQISGRSVPTFLSSMLTRGAMDTFSKERLGWHLRKVLREYYQPKSTYGY